MTDINLLTLAAIIARKRRGLPAHQIAAEVAQLAGAARQLHRLAEHDCNHGLTPRQEKRRERLEQQARDIAKGWRVTAEFGLDVRSGAAIRLDLGAGGPSNSWGGGWTV